MYLGLQNNVTSERNVFESVVVNVIEPMRPRGMRLPAHQEAESLTVEWSAPVCPYSGYISHYVLEYCRMDHDCGRLCSVS